MEYTYIAYTQDKQLIKGKVSASTEDAALEILDRVGYRVVNLKKSVRLFPDLGKIITNPIKPSHIITFSRQLALLLESGVGITQSIEILQSQAEDNQLRKILGVVLVDVRGGNSLASSLEKHKAAFSPMYCRTIAVGEQTGSLETVLRNMADHIERESSANKRVRSALIYPSIVFILAIIVIVVLVVFVMPIFVNLYGSLGAELPMLTRLMIDATNWLFEYGLYLIIGLATLFGLGIAYIRTPAGKYQFHKLILRLPAIGRLNLVNELGRACRSMSILYHAGLPLPEIMALVINSTNNKVIAQSLGVVQRDMIKGEGISQPMAKDPVFPHLMVQMVKVGEETGNLDDTLNTVAQSYEMEAEERVQALIAMIEPAMTVFMGGMVGLIAVTMITTMYSVLGSVG